MKKLSIILTLFLICYMAFAGSVKVEWCPNVETNVIGYKLYYIETNKVVGWTSDIYSNGTSCFPILLIPGTNWIRNYTTNVDVGLVTTYTLSNAIVGKTYYLSVKAYNSLGLESEFSNEIEATVTNTLPSSPQNFQILEVR